MTRTQSHFRRRYSPRFALAVLFLLAGSSLAHADTDFTLLSASQSSGAPGTLHSDSPSVDGSGDLIAFHSASKELVSGDVAPFSDIFLYQASTGELSNLTVGANGNSSQADISTDGSSIVFLSNASNLTNDALGDGRYRVVFYDIGSGQFKTGPPLSNSIDDDISVSRSSSARLARVSADGSRVLFLSYASDLPQVMLADQGAGDRNLYEWTIATDEVELVITSANFSVVDFDMTGDAGTVAVSSGLPLVEGEPLGFMPRVYLLDRTTDVFTRLYPSAAPRQPRISNDGRWVVFIAPDAGLLQDDNFGSGDDAYLLDTETSELRLVTVGADKKVLIAEISGDGSRILFLTRSDDLVSVSIPFNGATNLYLFDRAEQSYRALTAEADGESSSGSLSTDGSVFAFSSAATNLANINDSNRQRDVLARLAEDVVPVDCNRLPSGELASPSGVTVALLGTENCLGSGLFSYGSTDANGLTIPARGDRHELNLVPRYTSILPNGEFAFYRYPSGTQEFFFATAFVDRATGYAVEMSFRGFERRFQLVELLVYGSDARDRSDVVYREHDTEWFFIEQDAPSVLDLSVTQFLDEDGNGVLDGSDRALNRYAEVQLFYCNGRDGLAGTATPDQQTGVFEFSSLAPGSYQLAMPLHSFYRFTGQFTGDDGEWVSSIRSIASRPDGSTLGFTACTDFSAGGDQAIGAIGFQPRP